MLATTVVTSLTMSDGTDVLLPEHGVTLFVGPNNAGKSQALRDIASMIVTNGHRGIVVTGASVEYRGSIDELIARFEADGSIMRQAGTEDRVMLGASGVQSLSTIKMYWGATPFSVARYFVLLADTETRLVASHPTTSLDLFEKSPKHPLHHLYLRPELEERLRSISREAFGTGVILDVWAGGSSWALRVGDIAAPESPRPDEGYLNRLKKLPLLKDEGDGVRSMVGILLGLLTGNQVVSLIDEPEAFLHPPQARFLAKLLSEDASTNERAVFLSTHSSDVVHGTLEGRAPATVVRLQRVGNVTRAAVLDNNAVRRLWSDPLLRYSNLLEGLFTDAVVICESDADCKFFASIRDRLISAEDASRRPDVLFTSCGGKSRLHVGIEALRAANVPVVAIGDFDVLNDWGTLSRLTVKAGGETDEIGKDWRVLNSALVSEGRTPSVAGIREAVTEALDRITEVSAKSLEPVREALKVETGWARVKNTGLAGVPKGQPFRSAERLLAYLRSVGVFLIPLGEMEDFMPLVSGHGSAWLSAVLEEGLHEKDDAKQAEDFLSSVLDAVSPSVIVTGA